MLFYSALCFAENFSYGNYYYYQGKRIELPLNKNKLLVYYKNQPSIEKELQKDYQINKIEHSSEKNGVICSEFLIESENEYKSTLEKLRADSRIVDVERFFGEEKPVSVSNHFYVNLLRPDDVWFLNQMAEEMNVKVIGPLGLDCWYELETSVSSYSDALGCSNMFFESNMFKDVDPGFNFELIPASTTVTDSSFDQQWAIDGIGVDIHVTDAWDITKGKQNVKAAVVDGRINDLHNEFVGTNFLTPYDAELDTNVISCYYSYHGTGVASIMAANHNAYEIAGVAPGLSYINTIFQEGVVDAAIPARAISYACNHGAAVINCSWGFGYNVLPINSAVLENALDSALYSGRNGKGCIIVFASGNDNRNTIPYPANYNSDILVVGAVKNDGTRANFGTGNGSNYGALLDVVAPGVDIYLASTDYIYPISIYDSLWGTSFAAPHVTAIAGLILSVAPNLSREQVVDLIELSCQKDAFISQPDTTKANGKWSYQYGYGLVDAYKSLVKEVNDSIVSADVLSNSVYPAKGCFVKINNLCDYNQTCTEIDINSYVCTEIDGLFSINDSYLFINSLPSSP